MKLFNHQDMIRGWFVGNFEPSAWKTPDFEVGYRIHEAGPDAPHYHTEVTEVNLVVSGKLVIQGKTLTIGDIFILEPWEIADAHFLEPTGIVCVKMPSSNDKKLIDILTK